MHVNIFSNKNYFKWCQREQFLRKLQKIKILMLKQIVPQAEC